MKTTNMIRKIVRLKQLVQRWRRGIPPAGSFAVYVGNEHRRFVIPIRFINLPVFVSLLNKAEEEFGYQTTGGLVLPCNIEFFKMLLSILERDERRFGSLDLDDFTEMFSVLAVDSSSTSSFKNDGFNEFSSLLQKIKV